MKDTFKTCIYYFSCGRVLVAGSGTLGDVFVLTSLSCAIILTRLTPDTSVVEKNFTGAGYFM